MGAHATTTPSPALGTGCHVSGSAGPLLEAGRASCRSALPRVQQLLPVVDVAVVVPADDAEASALVPQAGDLGMVAAVATEDRVVLVPTGFDALTDVGRDVVMAHEIAHLATRPWTTSRTPLWLVEGLAEQVALASFPVPPGRAAAELAVQVRQGTLPDALPADAAFGGMRAAEAYQQAWLAVDLLTHRYGAERVFEAYRRAGQGGTTAALASLGTTERELVADWRRELVRRLA